MRLGVSNISRCYFLNKKKLEGIVKFILSRAGVKDANLSIVFATDREIKRLNSRYLGRDRATDVISFSMREGKRLKKDNSTLGDIVISVDRAKKQAERFGSTFKKEIYLYIIHGILHLLGYTDERPPERKRMQRKEAEILGGLCKGRR
jgi:probable rRNA maturation factor